MTLTWLAFAAGTLVLLAYGFHLLRLSQLRRCGLYPQARQATMADVERLLANGLPVWAMRCYREIHGCGLRQAREAVAALAIKNRP